MDKTILLIITRCFVLLRKKFTTTTSSFSIAAGSDRNIIRQYFPSKTQYFNTTSFPLSTKQIQSKSTMKSSFSLIQFLIPLLCIINAANAFVAPGTRPLAIQRNSQRETRSPTSKYLDTLDKGVAKEATKTEESVAEKVEEEEDLSETQKLMKQVKEAGTAGVISYALWEMGFWALSVRRNSCCISNLNKYSISMQCRGSYDINLNEINFVSLLFTHTIVRVFPTKVPVCVVGYQQVRS